jgi:Family of unknown function (DUF5681)
VPSGEKTPKQIPQAMEANKWKPGQSGNPTGRPRKTPVSDAYAKHVGKRLPDEIRLRLRLPKGATWADAMALGQLRSAVKGKTDAAREIADRVDGKAMQLVELSGPDGGPIVVDDLAAGRARVKAWREKHPKQLG